MFGRRLRVAARARCDGNLRSVRSGPQQRPAFNETMAGRHWRAQRPRIAIPATKPIHQRTSRWTLALVAFGWFADTAQPQPPSPYFYLGEGGGDPILVYLGAVDLVRQERISSSFFCGGRVGRTPAMEKFAISCPSLTLPFDPERRRVASTKQTQQKKQMAPYPKPAPAAKECCGF